MAKIKNWQFREAIISLRCHCNNKFCVNSFGYFLYCLPKEKRDGYLTNFIFASKNQMLRSLRFACVGLLYFGRLWFYRLRDATTIIARCGVDETSPHTLIVLILFLIIMQDP